MGNTKSSSSWTEGGKTAVNHDNSQEIPLAMMAVARNAFLHRDHILSLRNAMFNYSDEDGMIKRDGFDKALNIAHVSNVEVFDLLFTMWDDAEDEKVSVKKFCVGTSPLACPFDDLPSIITFAIRVGGDLNREVIKRQDLKDILTGKCFPDNLQLCFMESEIKEILIGCHVFNFYSFRDKFDGIVFWRLAFDS